MSRPKGFSHSKETRRKIGVAIKGRKKPPFSKEHRRKMSEAHEKHKSDCLCFCCKAKRGEFKGSKHSEETKRKMREVHKGKQYRLGSNPDYPNGHPERFRRLSRKVWEEHYGVPIPIDKRTGKTMPIHHRDLNVFNIAWQNLRLLSFRTHPKIHAEYRKLERKGDVK